MPDHIHLLLTIPHNMNESKAFQLLKGRSSYLKMKNREYIRLRYPQGDFWAAGGCAVTVRYNDLTATTNYIQNQAEHHGVEAALA